MRISSINFIHATVVVVHLPRSSSADFAAARDEVLDIHGTLDTEDVVNAAAEPIMVAIIASLYCVI